MFMFFHALALALSLFGGFGGFSHVGGPPTGAFMGPPTDGGGSMPHTQDGGGVLGSGGPG